MKYVLIIIIFVIAIYIYFLTKIIRYNLKCQQYLMEIDKNIDKIYAKLHSFIELSIEKKFVKKLSTYFDAKISTINQKNQFLDSLFKDINDALSSKELDITNFEVSNLNNELSNIHDSINNQIDQYNYYAEKYNKIINFKFIVIFTRLFGCKKKTLFKK